MEKFFIEQLMKLGYNEGISKFQQIAWVKMISTLFRNCILKNIGPAKQKISTQRPDVKKSEFIYFDLNPRPSKTKIFEDIVDFITKHDKTFLHSNKL
jgi:hypothetical protein